MEEENIEGALSTKDIYDQRHESKQKRKERKIKNIKTKRIFKWIISISVLGLVIFSMIFFSGPGIFEPAVLTDEITENDHIKGLPNSDIVLVEYSDFQCPACRAYFPLVKELVNEFGDDITFVYRHFPLTQIHIYAELAARVSEAAGKQGKFFEMHDIIFERQDDWVRSSDVPTQFVLYATELGLNLEQFATDLVSSQVIKKVSDDAKSGFASNVNSTPTFFLNGEKIQNPRGYEEFAILISDTIKEIDNKNDIDDSDI